MLFNSRELSTVAVRNVLEKFTKGHAFLFGSVYAIINQIHIVIF